MHRKCYPKLCTSLLQEWRDNEQQYKLIHTNCDQQRQLLKSQMNSKGLRYQDDRKKIDKAKWEGIKLRWFQLLDHSPYDSETLEESVTK